MSHKTYQIQLHLELIAQLNVVTNQEMKSMAAFLRTDAMRFEPYETLAK